MNLRESLHVLLALEQVAEHAMNEKWDIVSYLSA